MGYPGYMVMFLMTLNVLFYFLILHVGYGNSLKKCFSCAMDLWNMLNKELFGLSQDTMKISEYYTTVSSLSEEIDSMNLFPTITTVTVDVTALLAATTTQEEEG